MRVRRAGLPPALLWSLAWCGPLLLAATGAMLLTADFATPADGNSLETTYPNIVFGSLVPMLGALILTRLPRQPIGWLFLGCGLASAVTMAVFVYAEEAVHHGLPWTLASAWVSEWVWGFGLIPLVTIGVLLFPDGRPPGRRWRLLLAADLLAVTLVFCANAFHPGRLVNHPALGNPLGMPLPRELFTVIGSVGSGLFLVGLLGGVAGALLRWRRAGSELRAQLSWFAFAVATLAVTMTVPLPRVLGDVLAIVAIPLLPVSVAVAILRHHLYGIEVVVRRSLVYAALTAVLLFLYAVAVTAIGALLQDRSSQTAALVGTAVVAIAFAPVRQRVQQGVDRVLYGDRGDPYTALAGLGRSLGAPGETADPLAEVVATVAATLRLPYVRVEVDDGPDAAALVEETGTEAAGVLEIPLTYRDASVGRLLVAPRTPRDPFRASDLRLLDDLGRQIGVAAHAMRLARDLQRSREGLVTLREEERRRIRRDLHDGLGPTLAGVALGLDAVGRLTAQDPEAAVELAGQLKAEVQTALTDVRRLVEEMRPPALDQLGLVGAVRQQAQRITDRDPALQVALEADPVNDLPAAVEVAAYRIATEALTNVSRHAAARSCRVSISFNGDLVLRVEVEDDGVGLPDRPSPGVGLGAMRERAVELGGSCVASRIPRGGTLVVARIPVGSR